MSTNHVTMHCPHAMLAPCSTCEDSAAARELRALRALKVAVELAQTRVLATKVHHVEIGRDAWFAIMRAAAQATRPAS